MTSDTSHRPVSPLRARMIEDMTVRGFSEQTRSHYVWGSVRSFHFRGQEGHCFAC